MLLPGNSLLTETLDVTEALKTMMHEILEDTVWNVILVPLNFRGVKKEARYGFIYRVYPLIRKKSLVRRMAQLGLSMSKLQKTLYHPIHT